MRTEPAIFKLRHGRLTSGGGAGSSVLPPIQDRAGTEAWADRLMLALFPSTGDGYGKRAEERHDADPSGTSEKR